MNIKLPNKDKKIMKNKIIIIFVIVILLILLGIVINKENSSKENVTQVGDGEIKTDEEYNNLKSQFDTIFTNKLESNYDLSKIKLENSEKELVYTTLEAKETSTNDYDIKIDIPYINIDSEIAKKINNEINQFSEKYKSILNKKNKNIIYDVEYCATIEEDILSLVIKSNLKEGTSAQRVIIQTYNYDLKNNTQVKLQDIILQKNIDKNYVQNKINEEIKKAQKNAEDLNSLGYNIYERNIDDDIYILKNIDQYCIYKGNIYIFFAYGNDARTSEMDLVII